MTFAQPFSDYEILERVGAGAMGTVFKARHKRLDRIVAIKVLKPSLARDARYVERLRREARLVASLNHPNVVVGHDLGEESGFHYFVMEFVAGRSLRSLLAEWGMFAEEQVRKVARQVALALDHAWQRGVIHRDVKPGNILVDDDGNVKLADLGLAKSPTDASLTRDGATLGTPHYISPEQARDPDAADVRSDLYSLGATLYHMATGVPPFQGATLAEVLTNVMNEPPVSPLAINSGLSEGMSLVIRKLLAKDPALRYQTPRELLDDLDRIDGAARPLVDADRLARAEGDRGDGRARLWLGVAAALGLVAVAWWLGLGLGARGDDGEQVRAASYLAALDAELAAASAGGKALLLRAAAAEAPVAALPAVTARQRAAGQELARAVAGVAAALLRDEGALRSRLGDPATWPDLAAAQRELVDAPLLAAVGARLADLPAEARAALAPVDEALAAAIAQRDAELGAAFARHCATDVERAVADALARDDFRGAEAIWREALDRFLDGASRPASTRLADATMRALTTAHQQRQAAAVATVLDAAESAVAAGLVAEAEAIAVDCEELVRNTLAADFALAELAQARADLARRWPPSERFRPGRSPWRQAERRLDDAQREASADAALQRSRRGRARSDLAWTIALGVGVGPALQVLGDAAPADAGAAAAWSTHRRALRAAAALESVLAEAVAAAPAPIAVKPLAGGAPLQLLAAEDAGRRVVRVRAADGSERGLALAALRPADLLALLPPPFVAAADGAFGAAVWLLAGDDLDGFARRLPAVADADEAALVDEVAPTVARVRSAPVAAGPDRLGAFAALQAQLEAVRAGAPTDALEAAFAKCLAAAADAERTDAEDAAVQAARTLVQAAARMRRARAAMAAAAPAGAEVALAEADGSLSGTVTLPVAALAGVAPASWRRADGRLQADATPTPKDADAAALRGTVGFEPSVGELTVAFDATLPAGESGPRVAVFVVRGVAIAVCVDGRDGVRASVVRGDPARDEAVADAVARALAAPSPAAAVAVPGADHRIELRLVPNAQRTSALVEVRCDGAVLLAGERRALDPQAPPTFAVLPLAPMQVRAVAATARID